MLDDMEVETDRCKYLPTEEEIEEALVPLRVKKIQQMKDMGVGGVHLPKQHGRVMYQHHRWNGYVVLREQ